MNPITKLFKICAVIAFSGLLGLALIGCQSDPQQNSLAALEHSILEIGESCENSIVVIDTRQREGDSESPDSCNHAGRIGSGFVYRIDGYIVTTDGVLEGALDYTVTTQSGKQYRARLIGRDFETNIAVLKVDDLNLDPIPLTENDSSNGCIGILMGNTYYSNGLSCSLGLVNRTWITGGDFLDNKLYSMHIAIADVNGGAPVVDSRGRLIGITEGHLAGKECQWTLIPSSTVRAVADHLIDHGDIPRGWFGIVSDPRCENKQIANLLQQWKGRGTVVSEVVPQSPADRCAIAVGDVIVRFNQDEINCSSDLRGLVTASKPGSEVTLQIVRDGQRITVETELEALAVKPDRKRRCSGRTV
ncbi:S1C family serine protease [bacterium]|nr:S1C family serine protease [bacterium]